MSADADLLLTCARARVKGVPPVLPPALRDAASWQRAFALAAAHGVLPLVASMLLGAKGLEIPAAILTWARERLDENVQRTLVLSLELHRVRAGLSATGIRSIALKGPALAARVYGAPYLRRCRDLDLLVEPGLLWRAHEVVQALGYHPFDPVSRLEMSAQRGFLAQAQQVEYGHEALDVALDLQCRIAPAFVAAPQFDGLWTRRTLFELPGGTVDVLGETDLLLSLCLHGLRHGWERFQWVVDVALAANQVPPGNWSVIEKEARRWRAHRALTLGLGLASATTGFPIDPPECSWVGADRRTTRLAARARAALFSGATRWARAWMNFRMQVRAQDRASGQFAYLAAVITTPSAADWIAWRLPPAWAWAYLWLRPLRLVADYAGLWKKPPRA